MIHFLGVRNGDTTAGVTGTREVPGGVITFTTTAAPPAQALEVRSKPCSTFFGAAMTSSGAAHGGRTVVPTDAFHGGDHIANQSHRRSSMAPLRPTRPPWRRAGPPRNLRIAPSVRPMVMPRTVREGAVDLSNNLDPWFINLQVRASATSISLRSMGKAPPALH